MNKPKKTLLLILGAVMFLCAAGVLCIGLQVAPTVNHALRISELLQPLLDARNQTMHIGVSAKIDGNALDLESDIFLVSEDGVPYLAVEQNGAAIYVTDNVLVLENGKAFRIGESVRRQVKSWKDLLPQIRTLYEVMDVTAEETDSETSYFVTVSGEQVDTLLAAASLGEALLAEAIEKLNLCLTERNGKLDQIRFFGCGKLDGTSVELLVTLSGFRALAAGDYPVPEAVQQSAAAVKPEELFSLTEDMYRLLLSLAPFAEMESIDGTLDLAVDCGPLQLDTRIGLSDLKTTSGSQIDLEKLRALPQMLGWLCMEGEIACTRDGNTYLYTLALDQASMKELSRMILPELGQYGGNLTEGSIAILLNAGRITSMNVTLDGKISAWITQVPIAVDAGFTFR